jgi:hypothetical protein
MPSHFNLIFFALSFQIIYIWARGEALHLPIETSILGSLKSFRVFFFLLLLLMGSSKWLIAEKKQLILGGTPL